MQIGQMANYTSFLEDKVYKTQLIQLVSEDDKEWRFRVDTSDMYHLTVSKDCGFDHTWYTGENKTLKRRTLIEPY